jgi:hypothetical protein
MRALVLIAIVLSTAVGTAQARAQTNAADASAQADKVFKEGRMAANAGDYTTARARFLESERLDPAPGTLLNVADCEVHLGLLVAAREHFELAASGFPRGDNRRGWATTQAAQLDKRLARLTLRLSPDAPAGTTVTKGGTTLDTTTLGRQVLTDPGKIEITVTAPGRVAKPTTLTLGEGQTVEQVLTVGDPAPAPATPAAPSSPEPAVTPATTVTGHPYRTLGLVLGGVGIAGLVVGSVAGILSLSDASTVKGHCNTSTWACDSQGVSAASNGNALATLSDISFVAGAVLAGVGAYFVLTSREEPATVTTTGFYPYADSHGAGAAFSRSF